MSSPWLNKVHLLVHTAFHVEAAILGREMRVENVLRKQIP